MAATYKDIISIRGGHAAYSLDSEENDEWRSFITNDQFNKVLLRVLQSVRGNDIDNHKSFWLWGTYGTGKSHAAAVISHLLEDPLENIKEWVNEEYSSERHMVERSGIIRLRECKRLLTVKLYGLENMSHSSDLAPVMQKAVLKSLNGKGIETSVISDFEGYIEHISSHKEFWGHIISSHPHLAATAPDVTSLIDLLKRKDLHILHLVADTLRDSEVALRQDNAKLKDWLVKIQNDLRKNGDYSGLMIMWDEFTDVMRDPIGLSVLKSLQELAETFASVDNGSYLFLISHPSAFDNIGAEQLKQTDGRYHRMQYNMEPASAYRIMSSKFKIQDEPIHKQLESKFFDRNPRLLETYIVEDQKATEGDLRRLFPLHPGTANLATYYATVIGAATRGVFEFLASNGDIKKFLEDPNKFRNDDAITADYLWDYILKDLQGSAAHYGAVIERYNLYLDRVRNVGDAYLAIFKSILLLNAFNNVSDGNASGLITPSEENIKNLYTGACFEQQVDAVLKWLNDEAIIQRAPGGMYSVQFSALPPNEIEEQKAEMRNTYRRTSEILKFGEKNIFRNKFVKNPLREFDYVCYSNEDNDSILRDKIKKKRKSIKGNRLFFALFLSRNSEELLKLKEFSETCTNDKDDKDLRNIIFVVFDELFRDNNYRQFIDYMANQACAARRGVHDQSSSCNKNAEKMVQEWLERVLRGNATIYINGTDDPRNVRVCDMSQIIKDYIDPLLYPYAPEACEQLRKNAQQTFWNPKISKDIVRKVLFLKSFSEVSGMTLPMSNIQYLMQDCLDDNLKWKDDVSDNHPLKKVCLEVDTIIKKADRTQAFDFEEKFKLLTEPPYGFHHNYANMAVLAFAMRPWVKEIFDLQGKPRDENAMADDIALLFKVWDGSKKAGGKLSFKFQTPEEGLLCNEIIRLFSLDAKNKECCEISSLTNAKFVIINSYLTEKKAPLWALKYASRDLLESAPSQIEISEPIKHLIDNINDICTERELRKPDLVKETLKLISELRIDVQNILNLQNVFSDGFQQFLQNIELVNIRKEELGEVMEYICQHSESSVGYWTEKAVKEHAKNWRLMKSQTPISKPTVSGEAKSVVSEVIPQDGERSGIDKMRIDARKRIEQICILEEAKKLLLSLCNEGNEWLLSKIIK